MQGKIVLRQQISQNEEVDLHELQNGIYQIIALDLQGRLSSKRLAIVK